MIDSDPIGDTHLDPKAASFPKDPDFIQNK